MGKRFRPLAVLLVLVSLVGFTEVPAASAEKINTAYISVAPSSSAVIWVTKEAGLFERYGLDATVIFISGSIRGIQAILAGDIPIGEGGGPGLASARLAGGDVVAIAGNINVLPYTIRRYLKAYVEAIHYFKTHKEETMKIMRKYSRVEDRRVLEESWEWHTRYLPESPYAPLEGYRTILHDLAAKNPKAAQANPNDYIEMRFVKELEDSGFIKSLYKK